MEKYYKSLVVFCRRIGFIKDRALKDHAGRRNPPGTDAVEFSGGGTGIPEKVDDFPDEIADRMGALLKPFKRLGGTVLCVTPDGGEMPRKVDSILPYGSPSPIFLARKG